MDPKRFTRRLVALGAAMFLVALVFVVTLFDALTEVFVIVDYDIVE